MTTLDIGERGLRLFVRDCARGRAGAGSERRAGGLVWFPMINGERIPMNGSPFPTQTQAKDAARDFKARCREELGEP